MSLLFASILSAFCIVHKATSLTCGDSDSATSPGPERLCVNCQAVAAFIYQAEGRWLLADHNRELFLVALLLPRLNCTSQARLSLEGYCKQAHKQQASEEWCFAGGRTIKLASFLPALACQWPIVFISEYQVNKFVVGWAE